MSTSLLVHCDGSSFVDETGRTVTAVGNAAISTAQFAALTGNAASGVFDGTGDYLTVPDSPDFDFGAGDFTVECFVRRNSGSITHGLLGKRASSAVFSPFILYIDPTGIPSFLASFTGAAWGVILQSPSNISASAWHHIAGVRSGSTWSLYVDGVRTATTSASGTLFTNAVPLVIGGDVGSNSLNGYLDEVRISKGTAVYAGSTLTVPTAPFTYSTGSTFGITTSTAAALVGWKQKPAVTGFLLHMDGASGGGTFVDSSLAVNAVSKWGTPTTSLAVAPVFGATSMLGTGLYLADTTALRPIQTDFTVELWVRPTSRSTEAVLVSKAGALFSPGSVEFVMKAGGALEGRFSADAVSWVQTITTTDLIPLGAWVHVALCRYQGVVSIYIGGVLKASGPLTVNLATEGYTWNIGQAYGGRGFTGNIDEVRYTYGRSVYTADFTVPTAAFVIAGLTTSAFTISTGTAVTGVGLGTMHGTEFSIASGSVVTTDASIINTHTTSLLHMDGANGGTTFVDECRNRVVRNGGPVTSTAQGKYGSQSAYFDGNSSLTVFGTTAAFNIATNRFLFEVWVYPTAREGGVLFRYGNPLEPGSVTASITATGTVFVKYLFQGGTVGTVNLETVLPLPLDTWSHVAVGNDSAGTQLYINGAESVGVADTGGSLPPTPWLDPTLTIGEGFTGYLEEFRFTNGLNPYGDGAFTTPTVPFLIPDASSAAFFIYEGATADFVAGITSGVTVFSIQEGSSVAMVGIGKRTVPASFSADGATTTRFDGWLLIGAESYFTVDTGSDFWFRSSGIIADPPGFSIATGSVVSFVAPAQPVATKARFFIDTASDFAPRTHVARAGAFAIWPRARVMWKTGQNAPYVFSIQAGSTLGMKGVALREMTYALAAGSDVLFAARGAAPSRFSIEAGAVGTFASRKHNGGGYSIPTETILALFSSQGYLEPSKPYVGFENIFFLQAHAATAVLTTLDSTTFLEQT